MSYRLQYTREFYEDFERYYGNLAEIDLQLAERVFDAMQKAIKVLEDFPFAGRRAVSENAFARELLVPFGSSGYILLYEVEDSETVTILAVRHQREDDYH
ncbi:type II toxin-antitoxin system RelE/ParE family toxin [Neorhizobium galegae]|uniref:type II toxin-antitoxin system RelE/ParE family toxin n=1 Tax=Neorhizobium galegae TaxID=399 RepID=UPI0006229CB9|nr:type II toxin-antitoxin system RelE/ParE family toxin [Neorhizobium galegae]CDZ29491.1 Plasmid stabilization system protein [Neorhizobium galegae bv. officinalis]KAA9386244.1 type II toxin-antitoxin system RelE/ParE family toxin [Neorhizobium galegae]KAB1113312.1 type II toxin-antitoxin system RelE/ParE family toxin [Neorhizobium galegae]MCM2496258.1 type II toxin-antitoxin system RelE/ParE family toxin [Neorhizobium galegae]MCQ1770606.1 type II toxin-antitoxin system RelE/ParE family toxin